MRDTKTKRKKISGTSGGPKVTTTKIDKGRCNACGRIVSPATLTVFGEGDYAVAVCLGASCAKIIQQRGM